MKIKQKMIRKENPCIKKVSLGDKLKFQ